MSTVYFGANQTNLSYPSTGRSATRTFTNDPAQTLFGHTPAAGAGVATLLATGNPSTFSVIASATGNPNTSTSDANGWLSINVPQNGVLSYQIESTSGSSGTASVDSFFELSSTFTNKVLTDYTLNAGKNISVQFGVAGVRTYTIPNNATGYVAFSVDGAYGNSNVSSITFTNGSNVVTTSAPTNPDQTPALFVTAGQNTVIQVTSLQDKTTFYITGQYYAEPTFDMLKSAHTEIANSLTLNPTQSALMLDANNRAEEAFYADRAREGEFGYEVRRRLHLLGYNV